MPRKRSRSQHKHVAQGYAARIAAGLDGAKRARMPGFVRPRLATVRGKIPSGRQWLHEIKLDGYRLQLHKRENDIRLFTHRSHDCGRRFSRWSTAPASCLLSVSFSTAKLSYRPIK